ncbi:MAG: tRNA (N6-isopentenyl adenosine(37)-C2)-methylthiotransferase MiaB [Chthoniobacterales bacterium]|nr:tRNA (N6-isopentenyl adenosine(37)-C2)-methylthiotransferase MiaB [Chthoniobacterales bacterium]
MPKVFLKTYGCQMNERDSEQVAQMLVARGYEVTDDASDADVVLLNTCSVRDMAEQKALGKMGTLRRLQKKRPHTVFGFLGCMAQSRGSSLLSEIPHLDLVVGTQKFHRVADHVDAILRRKMAHDSAIDDPRFSIVDTDEEAGSQETIRDHASVPASAFVSIMQGCNMRCTFCIVPDTRGAERSRRIGSIVGEVREIAGRGCKEVTLLGQIVNLYGRHEFPKVGGHSPFVQLLEAVHEVEGLERLRFTSPHPIGFREDLIECFARLPKLAEHVHLPLQSGSDRILKAMHRGYTADKFRALVGKLRAARPDIAITTDIIVGFPGETDEDYSATRTLADEISFDNAFVFRYSPRKDTPAATMHAQVPEEVREERNQDLLSVVNRHAQQKLQDMVGRTVEVLCTGSSRHNDARLTGRTRGNKIAVFEGPDRLAGELVDIDITETAGFTLYAANPRPAERGHVALIA